MSIPSTEYFRLRLGITYFALILCFLVIAFRLTQLQVLENDSLHVQAQRQFRPIPSRLTHRRDIVDRNGLPLAVDMRSASVFAHPAQVRERKRTSQRLTGLLGKSDLFWRSRLAEKKPFLWLRRHLDQETGEKIQRLRIPGIYVKPEMMRFYPNGSLAASIVGFTDIDGKGISGIELSQNDMLRMDPESPMTREEAETPVRLTIDRNLQYQIENELSQAMKEHGAAAVLAIVMDPFTGELLAMAQSPSFDPNRANQFSSELFLNRALSRSIEPGSTLKAALAAESLELGLLSPNSVLDGHHGKIEVERKIIREAEVSHNFGKLSLAEVIRYSSNIGAVQIAQKLGANRVRGALERFGLSSRTRVGLPGEIAGTIKPLDQWTPLLLANIGFGQGLSVTPLQITAAFAPFANGGYWVRPKILETEVTSVDRRHMDLRRVISPHTALRMRDILTSVTEDPKGTGRQARVQGISVAGKTGTAQKYEPGKGYKSGKYLASFIGFLPADHPQVLVSVFVDEPKKDYYGAQVAAPLFRRIAQQSLHTLDRAPRMVARVVQPPAPPAAPAAELESKQAGTYVMPDLKGMSVREAMALLGTKLERVRVSGTGYLTHQEPIAGTLIGPSTPVEVTFRPPS